MAWICAVVARRTLLETLAWFATMAEPHILGGDEANACRIVFIAAKREIRAGPPCASNALAIQARLTYGADDRLMDAP